MKTTQTDPTLSKIMREGVRDGWIEDERTEPAQAETGKNAEPKRWKGWDWKDYQTEIIRQNYKIRDTQRLADALRKANTCASLPDSVRQVIREALSQLEGEQQ